MSAQGREGRIQSNHSQAQAEILIGTRTDFDAHPRLARPCDEGQRSQIMETMSTVTNKETSKRDSSMRSEYHFA